MFTENLSNMAAQPYSYEVNAVVQEAFGIFKSECTTIANQGGHSICTTAKISDWDFGTRTANFGNGGGVYYNTVGNIPKDMRESVFKRVQEQLCIELEKAGFINYNVEGIAEGPTYGYLYVFGRRTFLKDKSDPRYIKYIRITAWW